MFWLAYLIALLLFLLDALTSFEIKAQTIKSTVYLGLLFTSPVILLWSLIRKKSTKTKIKKALLPSFMLLGIFWIGPTKFIQSSASWQTQKILYKHGHLAFKQIEFQMQDMGALGYNKRTVDISYLSDNFMVVSPLEEGIEPSGEWIKADLEVNEVGLRFP